ncbi:MAG: alkaline phosphatase family protein [Anaerolineales bacterium]|nr:alkaline phosphatase family protein [Anaerolineales bacterium]
MTDLRKQLFEDSNHKLLSQGFPSNASIFPSYTGLSLLNLTGSIFQWFGLPPLPHAPLQESELDELAADLDQIIILLMDAVAFERMRHWTDSDPSLRALVQGGLFFPLTSVSPCTTSNVLTTLWTGCSPVEHAILAYELYLKEFGVVANMITHSPMALGHEAGLLYKAGFVPETALPVKSIGPALKQGGVDAHSFLHYGISNSGLSRMHYQDVERHPFGGGADLWIAVRQLAEQPRLRRRLIWVYHGAVDSLSHRYGPDSEQARAEFIAFLKIMQANFLEPLSEQGRRKSLLLVTADHGQVATPKNPSYELVNHPELMQMLHLQPTGENRFIFFHPKPGMVQAVDDYIHAAWPGDFVTMPSNQVVEAGLFGPGVPDNTISDRIGELIAIPTGNAYLWWSQAPNPLLGRHGAFNPLEMLVPLLALRLA